MQLIGMLDSPYVRRVAVTARLLGVDYVHRPISTLRSYDELREINPLAKVPTWVCDDGDILVDSSMIIDYLESISGRNLMPRNADMRRRAQKIIGIALIAMEKVVQHIYESRERPVDKRHEPWLRRIEQQLESALALLEQEVGDGRSWLCGDRLSQADVTTAVAVRFVGHMRPDLLDEKAYPGLSAFSRRAEALQAFRECPIG